MLHSPLDWPSAYPPHSRGARLALAIALLGAVAFVFYGWLVAIAAVPA